MLIFNSIQIVTLFAAAPFLIQWLTQSAYPYARLLSWVATVGYVCLFIWLICLVVMALEDGKTR